MTTRDELGFRVLMAVLTFVVIVTFYISVSTGRKLDQIDEALAQTIEAVEQLRLDIQLVSARTNALEAKYNRHMLGHGIRVQPLLPGQFMADEEDK